MTQTKLEGLQAGRAVAALMVVAFHANVFILPDRLYDGAAAARVFNMGYAGVEFFFVLSGFIMFFVHKKDFSRPSRCLEFLRRRVVRIYPIYWVILSFLLILYFVMPGRGPENARDPLAIVTSLLLWPMPELPIMRVAWTLQHEMLFYLLFAVTILNGRIGLNVFGVWMLGCVLASFVGPWNYPLDFVFSPYNVLFLFGIASAAFFDRLSRPGAMMCLCLGLALFLATGLSETYGILDWNKAIRTWSYGVGAALVTASLAAGILATPRWLVFLGDASYSIYLAHLPAMSILVVILAKLGAPWGAAPILGLLGMVLVATIAGAFVYVFVEKPLTTRLNKIGRPALKTSVAE